MSQNRNFSLTDQKQRIEKQNKIIDNGISLQISSGDKLFWSVYIQDHCIIIYLIILQKKTYQREVSTG